MRAAMYRCLLPISRRPVPSPQCLREMPGGPAPQIGSLRVQRRPHIPHPGRPSLPREREIASRPGRLPHVLLPVPGVAPREHEPVPAVLVPRLRYAPPPHAGDRGGFEPVAPVVLLAVGVLVGRVGLVHRVGRGEAHGFAARGRGGAVPAGHRGAQARGRGRTLRCQSGFRKSVAAQVAGKAVALLVGGVRAPETAVGAVAEVRRAIPAVLMKAQYRGVRGGRPAAPVGSRRGCRGCIGGRPGRRPVLVPRPPRRVGRGAAHFVRRQAELDQLLVLFVAFAEFRFRHEPAGRSDSQTLPEGSQGRSRRVRRATTSLAPCPELRRPRQARNAKQGVWSGRPRHHRDGRLPSERPLGPRIRG
ncbi:hypothetical protein DFJ74DRAFT_273614 [Hyaloraphidium curvatum]|nr:hypothetical protein DFJ74DRAFT_273614 [Hyaloraphidium curvatum]